MHRRVVHRWAASPAEAAQEQQEQTSADRAGSRALSLACRRQVPALMVMAATHIILRMCKSPLGKKLDLDDAETVIFAMIEVFRKRAYSSTDLFAYHTVMLPELWASKKVFVREGKIQNGLRVNMRYRLVSHFDSIMSM